MTITDAEKKNPHRKLMELFPAEQWDALGLVKGLPRMDGDYPLFDRADAALISAANETALGVLDDTPVAGGRVVEIAASNLIAAVEAKGHGRAAAAWAVHDLMRAGLLCGRVVKWFHEDGQSVESAGTWDDVWLSVTRDELAAWPRAPKPHASPQRAPQEPPHAAKDVATMIEQVKSATLDSSGAEVYRVATDKRLTADQRMREIARIDSRYKGYDSTQWHRLLPDVSASAIRQTSAWAEWQDERKRLD